MAHITFRLSASWSEPALHRLDLLRDFIERVAQWLAAGKDDSVRGEVHIVRVRRLAAHGCSGQALI